MLCQICHVNKASVKISQVINSKKIEVNLCKKCAEKKGMDSPMTNLPQVFSNFVVELFGKDILRQSVGSTDIRCPQCHTSWETFKETGLFGCDVCYQIFEEDLKIILRKIHGSNHHIGSKPNSQRTKVDDLELDKIKEQLDKAIRDEKFELAAKLRDMMRDAERQRSKRNDGILR